MDDTMAPFFLNNNTHNSVSSVQLFVISFHQKASKQKIYAKTFEKRKKLLHHIHWNQQRMN